MLWDLIYEFFVVHIFGGSTANGFYEGVLGKFYNPTTGTYSQVYTTNLMVYTYHAPDGSTLFMPLGNWLSITSTIISITIIVVLCCMFVYKIVKLIGGLIR